jgi:hypothetical protein
MRRIATAFAAVAGIVACASFGTTPQPPRTLDEAGGASDGAVRLVSDDGGFDGDVVAPSPELMGDGTFEGATFKCGGQMDVSANATLELSQTARSGAAACAVCTTQKDGDGIALDHVAFGQAQEGHWYEATVWVKALAGSPVVRATIRIYEPGGTTFIDGKGGEPSVVNGDWSFRSVRYKAVADAQFKPQVAVLGPLAANECFLVDDWELREITP